MFSLLGSFLPVLVFFTFLSPLWWLLVIGACVAIIFELEREKGVIAGLIILGTLVAMVVLGDTPLLSLLHENWLWGIVFATGYPLIGAIWGYIRWRLNVNKKFAEYEEEKRQWLRNHGINAGTKIPENLVPEFNTFLLNSPKYSYSTTKEVKQTKTDRYGTPYEFTNSETVRIIQTRPLAWQNKARIGNWIAYWPWSLLWWAIDDAVRSIVRFIRDSIMDTLEAISIKKFQGTEADYTLPPSEEKKVDG